MEQFDHERLHVYRVTIEFVALAHRITATIRGFGPLKDQLHRASTSIANNIAEGAGEFAPAEKRRFYRIARRSATESAAILDTVRCCQLLDDHAPLDEGRALLLEIVKMLTSLAVGREGKVKGKFKFKCAG
ncbi:MAG: four helix bundle protein [Deltaproteobacteria bacterium]